MGLFEIAAGVWVTEAPVRILGMRLASTMTVLRLGDELLLHSPVAMTPELREAVDALGPVRHLYAPNTFHHLRLGDWAQAYPEARVHAPPGLARKRPDLRIDRVHGTAPAPDGLDEIRIDGFRLEEAVLFHSASSTLVVADLVQNIGRAPGLWTRIYAGTMGFYDRIALSRAIRWGAFPDRTAARHSLDAVLALPIDRIVVGHGAPLADHAKDRLREALAWLWPS